MPNAENLSDRITSIRSAIGGNFVKPKKEQIEQFKQELQSNEEAIKYLKEQRLLSDETISHFNLGYNPVLDAISIPIKKNGEFVNIKYRFLKPENHGGVKYSSTRGAESWMFNDDALEGARTKGRIIITEGEFDCMSVWQRGYKSVISPGSGKDSYSPWVELLDNIPTIYVAYDNDDPGKTSSKKLAQKLGVDKCLEVKYPDDVKDANEFFTKYTPEDFKKIIVEARPYYNYEFTSTTTLLNQMRNAVRDVIKVNCIPAVEFGKDWLAIISGESNVGKTSFVMNIADELARQNVPVLIFPYERGIETVGKRFLQVKYNMAEAEFSEVDDNTWTKMVEDAASTQVYFAVPAKDTMYDVIRRARRLFGIGVVIVDHLDYMVRRSADKNTEVGNTLQDIKALATELGVLMLVVHHIKKINTSTDNPFDKKRHPSIEDLKGSSSAYQDPETVVMLYSEKQGTLTVDVQKNKGKMVKKRFVFNPETGRILGQPEEDKQVEEAEAILFAN